MKTAIRCIDSKWYAFGVFDDYQVVSIGKDCRNGGMWFAKMTDGGIRYCASPSPNRKSAVAKARRHGEYIGER